MTSSSSYRGPALVSAALLVICGVIAYECGQHGSSNTAIAQIAMALLTAPAGLLVVLLRMLLTGHGGSGTHAFELASLGIIVFLNWVLYSLVFKYVRDRWTKS